MAKGALATGVGVALMLGGGGTLAIWNDTETAFAGNIAAGNLDISAANGVWMKADGTVIKDFAAYRIVPGETLRFEQALDITLEGEELKATLAPTFAGLTDGFAGQLDYTYSIVQNNKKIAPNQILTEANDGAATATASVTFKKSAVGGKEAVQDLSKISYKLQQVAP
ncbi:alternate-type signal peptide domain-containing protein [Arthrobacter sp. 7Tela_A1]|uniref:alternate-type signal peptide domain-containing protein n=1 Tax=Arthrobacter sp. 7Tela_A1 TaxID=3093745 RepID=UPI003BB6921D